MRPDHPSADRRLTRMRVDHSPDYSDIVQNTWCMTTTATFSALLRTPNDVIEQLDGGDVLLTRRDAEPLRLSKARRVEREASTLSALSQLPARCRPCRS